MKLKIPITASQYVGLENPAAEFNSWKYRADNAILSLKTFEITAEDFPVFWQEFLERQSSLRRELRPKFVDVLRDVKEENFGVVLTKVMRILDS